MTKKNIEALIIEAAANIFLEKGMDGARMQEIAQKAGINQALLHYYFRSKERLFKKVMQNRVKTFFRSFNKTLPEEDDFEQFLKNFIDRYTDHIRNQVQFLRFIMWEMQRGAPVLGEIMREAVKEGDLPLGLLRTKVETAIERGEIRPVEPRHFIITVISACLYPFIARPVLEKIFHIQITDDAFITTRKKEVFETLWHGVKK